MRTACILLMTATLLFGCATRELHQPKVTRFEVPEVGVVATAGLGDALLLKGTLREYEAIYLPQPVSVGSVVLPAGYYYMESAMAGNSSSRTVEFFRPTEAAQLSLSSAGVQVQQMLLMPDRELCLQSTPEGVSCQKNIQLERKAWSVADGSGSGFQQTLIYSGRVGSRINAVYRESTQGYARPAFDNRIEYDLSESNVVGYKGARLEVLEATNQLIRYRVLKHFD